MYVIRGQYVHAEPRSKLLRGYVPEENAENHSNTEKAVALAATRHLMDNVDGCTSSKEMTK